MAVAIQRPLKGSRISSFYPVRSLPPLSALDSAFQLQEYISLLIRLDVHDVDRIVSIPGKTSSDSQDGEPKVEDKDAEKDGNGSVSVDEACWVYEQLRRLAQDLSHPLITMLQLECTRSTCPEMKAGEWLYLCVAHGNEGAMEQCCAIDYILHTLDSATALLNSPRAFPSRLSVPHSSHRHFSSLARRLGRIFAHAYFHHREAFEQAEAESSLYARFLALTSKFDLVPAEFLVIPPRLTAMGDDGRPNHVEPPRLLGASLDPHRNLSSSPGEDRPWNPSEEPVRNGLDVGEGCPRTSPAPPIQRRNPSPRKFGRNRTDTMVYSEAFSVAEELAKGELSEVDIDREIAAERAAAAVEADVPTSAVLISSSRSTTPPPPPEEPEVDERAQGEEEHHEEPKEEEPGSAHDEEPAEVPEPEVKGDEADDLSSHEETEPALQAESVLSASQELAEESQAVPEETSAHLSDAAEEKADADAVESTLLETHEEPAPKTEVPTTAIAPTSDAPTTKKELTEEAHKDEDEGEEEEEEEEEEGSDEEEESSDDDSDVSSTVLGVVHDELVVAAVTEKKEEAEPDVPEEVETEEAAQATEGEKTEHL